MGFDFKNGVVRAFEVWIQMHGLPISCSGVESNSHHYWCAQKHKWLHFEEDEAWIYNNNQKFDSSCNSLKIKIRFKLHVIYLREMKSHTLLISHLLRMSSKFSKFEEEVSKSV